MAFVVSDHNHPLALILLLSDYEARMINILTVGFS